MLSNIEYIKRSLGLHLFFARIMKEHSFFLEAGFTPKDNNLAQQADYFKRGFECILAEAVVLANGVVENDILSSGEVVTPYTLQAEKVTQYYTGINIQTDITQAELALMGNGVSMPHPMLVQRVYMLNCKAIELDCGLVQFKTSLLSDVLNCRIFTVNYPLLIDHILREAKLYLEMMQKLQRYEDIELESQALEQESFWNRIMGEHAKFIRGLLDPTENTLIATANNFGNEFDELTREALDALEGVNNARKITEESLKATEEIRDFKAQGTQGLLECKIRSIILPLLGDHVLREANHYLRLLSNFQSRSIT